MTWEIKISKEARKDYQQFDKGTLKQIFAGIIKVSQNPLPHPDGYGKPLGNKQGNNLTGFFKIKYKGIGIRVIYTLVMAEGLLISAVPCLVYRDILQPSRIFFDSSAVGLTFFKENLLFPFSWSTSHRFCKTAVEG